MTSHPLAQLPPGRLRAYARVVLARTGATRFSCGRPRHQHRGRHACTATGCTCPRMTPTPARRTA